MQKCFTNMIIQIDMSLDINKSTKWQNDYYNSEEGKKRIEEYFTKIKNEENIRNSQIEKFDTKFRTNLDFIIGKIITKYESDKYKNCWYNRGIEPPEDLYWLLFDYAEKHCAKCEDEKYLNMFTGEAYYIGSYVIQVMHGQGSVIKIEKLNERN